MDSITKAYMNMVTESFDSPLPTTKIPEDSMIHVMGAMSAAMVGGENFSMHKIPNQGFIVQFDKDGATEVHHIDENMQSGYKANNKKSAISFASTMANHIKNIIDTGKAVRISAHHSNVDGFRGISDRLIKLHPEYQSSDVQVKEHPFTGEEVHEWEVKRK
jgi:hypothetical protein